jgi:hypothetical protein
MNFAASAETGLNKERASKAIINFLIEYVMGKEEKLLGEIRAYEVIFLTLLLIWLCCVLL